MLRSTLSTLHSPGMASITTEVGLPTSQVFSKPSSTESRLCQIHSQLASSQLLSTDGTPPSWSLGLFELHLLNSSIPKKGKGQQRSIAEERTLVELSRLKGLSLRRCHGRGTLVPDAPALQAAR